MSVRLSQSKNAELPMLVMLFGIITFNLMNNKNEEMIKILF